MTTITLPLKEYQELIKYKENWEKGLILSDLGYAAFYISEEEFKSRIEGWCFERKMQLENDLEKCKTNLASLKNIRDEYFNEIETHLKDNNSETSSLWRMRLGFLKKWFQ